MENQYKKDLQTYCARVNNLIMKGQFTGDDVHEASFLMKFSIELYDSLQEKLEENEEDKSSD
jgi:hypothetical protein